jgi:hypothetical protein
LFSAGLLASESTRVSRSMALDGVLKMTPSLSLFGDGSGERCGLLGNFHCASHTFGSALETVRQDEKRWGPQANEDAEAFAVRRIAARATLNHPDQNRNNDRDETERKADAGEPTVGFDGHGFLLASRLLR